MAEVWKTRIFLFVLFLNDAVWRDSLGERMHGDGNPSIQNVYALLLSWIPMLPHFVTHLGDIELETSLDL